MGESNSYLTRYLFLLFSCSLSINLIFDLHFGPNIASLHESKLIHAYIYMFTHEVDR